MIPWTDFLEWLTNQYQKSNASYEKAYAYLKEAKEHPSSLGYQASGLFHFLPRARASPLSPRLRRRLRSTTRWPG
jgi:hypothetical protein